LSPIKLILIAAALVSCGPERETERGAPMDPQGEIIETRQQALGFNIDASSLPSSGCPIGGGTAAAREGNDYMQRWRAAMGLSCLTFHGSLGAAAQQHAIYRTNHFTGGCDAGPHEEKPGCSWFVGVHFWERAAEHFLPSSLTAVSEAGSEQDAWFQSPQSPDNAVSFWMTSVYHSTVGSDSRIRFEGGGQAITNASNQPGRQFSAYYTDTAAYPNMVTPDTFRTTVKWPPPGSTNIVGRAWNGKTERPTPPAPPGGWNATNSGPVIFLIADDFNPGPQDADWTLTERFSDGTNGPPIASTKLTWQNDPNITETGTYFMYANAPLKASTRYMVQIIGNKWIKNGGKCRPFNGCTSSQIASYTWTFTTRP
jgi:hypothetical protein